jgi:polar amino acid transport system permease protein
MEQVHVIREFSSSELWFLVLAVRWTMLLTLISFVFGGLAGLAVAMLRIAQSRLSQSIAIAYITIFQGTPLLLQLYLFYFGSNLLGLMPDPWVSAALGLTFYASAFLAEVWRGCLQAISKGQWDGARALGLSYPDQLRFVIMPQAFKIAIPPTIGFMVQLLKATSLVSIIGFTELTRAAQMVNNATFRPLTVYAIVAVLYFALCWPLSLLGQGMERRLNLKPVSAIKLPA